MPVVQMYAATTTELQNYYVEVLANKEQQPEIIFGLHSRQIDGVQYIARSSIVFDYILKNYLLM
jgi:hypothetical protein